MSQGNPHEGSPQPQSTPIVESLTGWQGRGLSELAELIALYPGFPLDIKFGTIGHPPRPIVHGYTPEQLAGALKRWEAEISKPGKSQDSPLYDQPQWELATLEAVQFMAGPTAAPVGRALEQRAEELRRQLENQYLFGRQPEPTPIVRVSTQTKRPRTLPRPELRAYAKEAVGSIQDFFTDLGQIGYMLARKPYLLLPSLALLACQVFGKTPEARVTPGGTETAPGPIATEVSPTMPPELVVTPPAGPDDPAVQEEAQTSQPPTFQEIIAAAPEARLVPPPEYRAWQTASGEPVGRQVQTQVDSVRSRVPAGTRVEVVVSSGQWAVVAFRDGQFYLPVDAQGKIIVSPYFRPDWLSLAVDHYAPFDLGLTGDYQPIAVQVNSHWRVGLETPDEQLVAVIEVAPDGTWEGLYNETALPEPQLGGDKVGIAFQFADGTSLSYAPPPEIASRLTPTPPERWPELMNLTDSNGQPLAWGKPLFYTEWQGAPFGDGIFPVIPFLVRDIVQYGFHKGENNAPIYLAILETPARGGSNFFILDLVPLGEHVNAKYSYVGYPSTGVPTEWLGQKVPIQTYFALPGDRLSDTEMLQLLQSHTGKVVLLEFQDYGEGSGDSVPYAQAYVQMVEHFVKAELLPPGFEALSRGIPSIFVPAKP